MKPARDHKLRNALAIQYIALNLQPAMKMTGLPPWTDTVPASQEIREAVTSLRLTIAKELAPTFLQQFTQNQRSNLISLSPYKAIVDELPIPNAEAVIAFNLRISELAVRHLIQHQTDPHRFGFLASRVVEAGMYDLHDLERPEKTLRHLAASKRIGYFFTPPTVAMEMAELVLAGSTRFSSVLDPAAGAGALLCATMLVATRNGARIGTYSAIERDKWTARLLKLVLSHQKSLLNLDSQIDIRNEDAITALYSDVIRDSKKIDRIVMNPPYGRVKFLASSLTNAETRSSNFGDSTGARRRSEVASEAERMREISSAIGLGSGPQDYQRLFAGLAMERLSAKGRLVMISPSSWLGDRDARVFRQGVMRERRIEQLILFPESRALFHTVNQPTAIAVLGPKSDLSAFRIRIEGAKPGDAAEKSCVSYDEIERLDPEMLRVPRLTSTARGVFQHLSTAPRIRDQHWLTNARGEVDLTLRKGALRSVRTDMRLIRGDHVERFTLKSDAEVEGEAWVDFDALTHGGLSASKALDMKRWRIAGRQVSYLGKPRRLSFSLIPPGTAIANSCNYITEKTLLGDASKEPLCWLLVLLNSAVVEWYFRINNSNNHVANYEIDELPCFDPDPELERALRVAAHHLISAYAQGVVDSAKPTALEDVADALVIFGFGLTDSEASEIMNTIAPSRAARVAAMASYFSERGLPTAVFGGTGWYQHDAPTLSELDREVISHIPQGGNWQDIPSSVPGKRLEQIREMSAERGVVRTTYYGRLRPDQPAYTIATYYNRPGNGTNIHPWEARTLSSREAARLQSFPDAYIFLGTEGAIRKQIGNAVPPLLAAHVGWHLQKMTSFRTCVDLFCGAGGLSLGLEAAGWNSVAAVDHDKHAVDTFGFNRPCERVPDARSDKTLLLQADLHSKEAVQKSLDSIRKKLGRRKLGLLAGGPPCQGFSHAGWRVQGDRRNDLAMIFMDFVAELSPEIVLLENVEGLLTHSGGQVLRDLRTTLEELGYRVGSGPWLMHAEQFGVPQMRRRVFLIGAKKAIAQPPAAMRKCPGRRKGSNATLTLFDDLPFPITTSEALLGLPALYAEPHARNANDVRSSYALWTMGALSFSQFSEQLTVPI